jgi:glycosyltransferase involved in cell wall biosynthesis
LIRRILILQTLPRPLVFSPNNALITLARHLDRRQFEMVVAVPRPGLFTEALAREEVRVVRVPGLRTYRRHDAVWRLPIVALRVASLARRMRADLIFANHAELGPFAHAAARLCSLPWTCFLRQADRSRNYYEKYRVARADAVGAVSEGALAGYRAYLRENRLPENPMMVVPTGIDVPEGTGEREGTPLLPPGWTTRRGIVGTVGLREVTRPEMLLDVLGRIAPGFPEARCLFVGAVEESRREQLESLARQRGISDRVWFAGQQREMGPWYGAMQVYAHTSRSEGFPKAALEAMAHGLPVIAFRVGGVPEAVIDGETGFLCDPDDLESFALVLSRLLADPDRARTQGEAGRKRVKENFSPEAMARGVEKLFHRLLGEDRLRDPAAGSKERGAGRTR